ncbi:hypothetical protein HMPREF3293_02854 [Christensenella minuta]|uniref:Uncharacterized protein n=1 Tax=Christensenella minuta TaxID=626937 RepID=A0A136Q0J8_9FIRM|nr:hypothetical protein HMPREF3293_02854 [Christensenella minuta]
MLRQIPKQEKPLRPHCSGFSAQRIYPARLTLCFPDINMKYEGI